MAEDPNPLIVTLESLTLPPSRPQAGDGAGGVVGRLRDEYWEGVQEAPDVQAPVEVVQVLGFRLDEHLFSVELGFCRSILRVPRLTRIPRCPRELLGTLAFRGEIFPVLDLRAFLELPPRRLDRRSRVVLLSAGGNTGALVVDRVQAIHDVPGPLAERRAGSIYLGDDDPVAGSVFSVPALLEAVHQRLETGGRA